jgi:spore germination protein GerM
MPEKLGGKIKMRILILSITAFLICAASFASIAAQKKGKAPKTREITIYVYQRPAGTSGDFYGTIVPVRRRIVNSAAPLETAFRLLLEGANAEERKRKLDSFIFGLKFFSARVRNKTAQINFKFINQETALESWEGGGFDHENFVRAVELTARQFPGVERVSICVSGIENYTNYDRMNPDKCLFPMFPPVARSARPK